MNNNFMIFKQYSYLYSETPFFHMEREKYNCPSTEACPSLFLSLQAYPSCVKSVWYFIHIQDQTLVRTAAALHLRAVITVQVCKDHLT